MVVQISDRWMLMRFLQATRKNCVQIKPKKVVFICSNTKRRKHIRQFIVCISINPLGTFFSFSLSCHLRLGEALRREEERCEIWRGMGWLKVLCWSNEADSAKKALLAFYASKIVFLTAIPKCVSKNEVFFRWINWVMDTFVEIIRREEKSFAAFKHVDLSSYQH